MIARISSLLHLEGGRVSGDRGHLFFLLSRILRGCEAHPDGGGGIRGGVGVVFVGEAFLDPVDQSFEGARGCSCEYPIVTAHDLGNGGGDAVGDEVG